MDRIINSSQNLLYTYEEHLRHAYFLLALFPANRPKQNFSIRAK